MFPWFGTLKYAKDEMGYMAKARYEVFRETKLEVMYQVQQRWYELFKIQAAIRITEKNIYILQTLERLALAKFRSVGGAYATTSSTASSQISNNISTNNEAMQGMSAAQTAAAMGPTSTASTMSMPQNMSTDASGSQLANIYRIKIDLTLLQDELAALQTNSLPSWLLSIVCSTDPPIARFL
ncbi:MAG: hypothetical protein ACP5PS_00155 [Bacteroidales bacterium]